MPVTPDHRADAPPRRHDANAGRADGPAGAIIASLAELVGLPLPAATPIAAADLPEPERSLLANAHDMTPTLERFHRCVLHLQVIAQQRDADQYRRQVLLRDAHERPVEFGAIRIHLAALTPAAQVEVLAGRRPLGGILMAHAVPHRSSPQAYFALDADGGTGAGEWGLAGGADFTGPGRLFGRCNVLSAPDGRTIAEVVEILPRRRSDAAIDGAGSPPAPPRQNTPRRADRP